MHSYCSSGGQQDHNVGHTREACESIRSSLYALFDEFPPLGPLLVGDAPSKVMNVYDIQSTLVGISKSEQVECSTERPSRLRLGIFC
jgi:hypothetical protein